MTSEKVARKTGHTVNADRTCALIAAGGGVAGVLVVDEEVAQGVARRGVRYGESYC
jgi:hypothetical protein